MKRFFHNNGLLLIIIAVLLAALLGIGAFFLGGSPLTNLAEILTTPFRAASSAVAEWAQDRYDRAFRYDQMEQANEELRQRLAELEGLEREYQDAIREKERLEDLLGLAEERPEFTYEDAQVTRRTTSNWESNLTIDRGSEDGVAVDDCVIDQYGNLVGVVTETGSGWALVATVLDPGVELGGQIARMGDDAILEGDFTLMLEGKLKLSYLPEEAQLVSGDQVTTSGLGEIFPAGLLVGRVAGVFTEADGVSRYAQIEPAADLDGVRYVYVITDFGAQG